MLTVAPLLKAVIPRTQKLHVAEIYPFLGISPPEGGG
jgi:hypothetical protein